MTRNSAVPRRAPTIAYHASIRDLQKRLKVRGFDWSFVQSYVLPEWWQDELAEVEANRALAELFVARQLGFSPKELRDRDRELSLPKMAPVRFKRYRNEVDDKVRVSTLVAQRAASVVARFVDEHLEPFTSRHSAQELRRRILQRSRFVDLESLVRLCWDLGIPVLHLAQTPQGSKRFDGMAAFIGDRPVIVLASGRDGSPWLAFHLAHEMGHILLRHVQPGSPPVVDGELGAEAGSRGQEPEADRFACELLTGSPKPRLQDLKLTGPRLAVTAERQGPQWGVDPGVFALIYGRSNDRWGVAQKALKLLDRDRGGQALIARFLQKQLADAELSESDERLLGVLQAA